MTSLSPEFRWFHFFSFVCFSFRDSLTMKASISWPHYLLCPSAVITGLDYCPPLLPCISEKFDFRAKATDNPSLPVSRASVSLVTSEHFIITISELCVVCSSKLWSRGHVHFQATVVLTVIWKSADKPFYLLIRLRRHSWEEEWFLQKTISLFLRGWHSSAAVTRIIGDPGVVSEPT